VLNARGCCRKEGQSNLAGRGEGSGEGDHYRIFSGRDRGSVNQNQTSSTTKLAETGSTTIPIRQLKPKTSEIYAVQLYTSSWGASWGVVGDIISGGLDFWRGHDQNEPSDPCS
jgi:hypothetical protein